MIAAVTRLVDQVLGRGEAATTVPPFDGQLRPNQLLETAPVVAEFDAPEDLATDGRSVFIANGSTVLLLDASKPTEVARFEGTVTALCCLDDGAMAVAVDGRSVQIVGGAHHGKRWAGAGGAAFGAVNAVGRSRHPHRLLLTDGSGTHPCERWSHDLMERGQSGRLIEIDLASGGERVIASGLGYAFGACAAGDEVWVCESWRHRLLAFDGTARRRILLGHLPVYPSRLSAASGGGFWLTAFTARTQLIEFVLRESAYRRRMMREVDPQYWIAPRLSSGHTFLEPMQGAHIKTMGILKPWAPPRSYGLVVRLNPEGRPRYSLHSRVDGKHHGVVAAVECGGDLFVLAKGCRRVLKLSVTAVEKDALG